MAGPWISLAALALAPLAAAAYFPPVLQNVNNRTSRFDPRIFVSSKEATGVCETTPNVKSYSGYVHMPADALDLPGGKASFPVNSFYWFFESRKDPQHAPFVLWLGGGPGFSSIVSALFENGPCYVNADSNSTTLNPLSWTNEANIIYIDSPAMTGYSYDRRVNATVDATNASLPITPSPSNNLPAGNVTLQVGTFGSQDLTQMSNSTGNTVPVIWTAMQAWLANFPQYKPANGVMSLWTESYGGRFGPLTSEYFMAQTQRIQNGTLGPNATALTIDTLGLINAWVDPATHARSFPAFVNGNTYGIQSVPAQVQQSMQQNLTMPGGCLDQIAACQAMVDGPDARDAATNQTSDQLCGAAFLYCEENMQLAYSVVGKRSNDDIAHSVLDPFPPQSAVGFLNQAWVQQALGAQVNFTDNSFATLEAFISTGDLVRDGAMAAVGRLLDAGVQVTMLSGDRDYQVNWFGGEAVSLQVNYSAAPQFRSAGYANLMSSNGSMAGFTRQAGNFSFSRIFQAGHSVPAYQPGVAFDVFSRAMAHKDVATGQQLVAQANGGDGQVFATQGKNSTLDYTEKAPPMPLPVCYTWEIGLSCTPEQQEAIIAGNATIQNFIVTNPPATAIALPDLGSTNSTSAAAAAAATNASAPSSTPSASSPASSAAAGRHGVSWGVAGLVMGGLLVVGL